ncbi:hypothetical protein BC830DRAFT_1171013 [Chytriomyces sp. MP71]|nr:hypothetical protein BC830DRAFT_1171013 [Chytriomyces sp. MP71]
MAKVTKKPRKTNTPKSTSKQSKDRHLLLPGSHTSDDVELCNIPEDYFIVDHIVTHRYSKARKGNEFKVRWKGYSAKGEEPHPGPCPDPISHIVGTHLADDTWEPVSSFAHPNLVEAYMDSVARVKQKRSASRPKATTSAQPKVSASSHVLEAHRTAAIISRSRKYNDSDSFRINNDDDDILPIGSDEAIVLNSDNNHCGVFNVCISPPVFGKAAISDSRSDADSVFSSIGVLPTMTSNLGRTNQTTARALQLEKQEKENDEEDEEIPMVSKLAKRKARRDTASVAGAASVPGSMGLELKKLRAPPSEIARAAETSASTVEKPASGSELSKAGKTSSTSLPIETSSAAPFIRKNLRLAEVLFAPSKVPKEYFFDDSADLDRVPSCIYNQLSWDPYLSKTKPLKFTNLADFQPSGDARLDCARKLQVLIGVPWQEGKLLIRRNANENDSNPGKPDNLTWIRLGLVKERCKDKLLDALIGAMALKE